MTRSETVTLPHGARLSVCVQDWAPYPGTKVLRGAVISCPGGGYAVRSRTEGEAVALAFAGQGYQAFTLHYGVGARAAWPGPLIDAAEAVACVRARADEWHIDPAKIALAGFSAGGHVAASLGTMWHLPLVQDALGAPGAAIRPDALILGYPALSMAIDRGSGDILDLLGPGQPHGQTLDATDTTRFVGPHTPPTFLWSIFDDGAIPVEQGLSFCARLAAHEVPFELHTFAHGEHACSLATGATAFGGAEDETVAQWFPLCCRWLKNQFGAPRLTGQTPDIPKMGDGTRAHPLKNKEEHQNAH